MSCCKPAVNFRSIMLATDFSEASDKPLRHALAIARHYRAQLHLAHVISSPGFTMAGPEVVVAAESLARREATRLEKDLAGTGALTGLEYKFLIRRGEVWEELKEIIRQENVDLVVLGTHGRCGIRKLLLGSVAEQIFRHADCPVLTIGPGSYQEDRVNNTRRDRTFLFPTDFEAASLNALSFAITSANQFKARVALLHVMSGGALANGIHWCTARSFRQTEEVARMVNLLRLEELTWNANLEVKPEFIVEVGLADPVSENILAVARKLKADVIIMGLHRTTHIKTASHMPWATAYEVVCGAQCPVLTIRD